MREYKQSYRVAAIGETRRHDGTFYSVMVARDGECWQIITGGEGSVLLLPGEEVEVSLSMILCGDGDRAMVPCWCDINGMQPVKYDLHDPYKTVADVWGPEIAERFFSPAEPTRETDR